MRIHIIKVLKYTNSILARFSSGPFLPPLVFGTKSKRVCSIEWDHRERGMDRCCSECRALLSYPAVLLPSNLADAAKSKTFQTTPPPLPPPPHVGARSGIGRDRKRECRKEQRGLCLSWEGRRRRKDSPKKEGPNVFALHEMKAQSFCGTDKRGF